MKNIAGLILVLLTAVESQAQLKKVYQRAKQAVTGSAKFSQLHYFPAQWEMDLEAGYTYSKFNLKQTDTGLSVAEADQTISALNFEAKLGILDAAYLSVEWDYVMNTELTYTKPANQPTYTSKGPAEPNFSGVWRVVDADSVKLDAKLGYRPSLGDHQEADSANEGDALSGGDLITAGGRFIALVTDNSQLALTGEYGLYGVAKEVDQITNQTTENNAHGAFVLQAGVLTEIISDTFFGADVAYKHTDAYTSKNLTSQLKTDRASMDQTFLILTAKREFTPDMNITGELGYLFDGRANQGTSEVKITGYTIGAKYAIRF